MVFGEITMEGKVTKTFLPVGSQAPETPNGHKMD